MRRSVLTVALVSLCGLAVASVVSQNAYDAPAGAAISQSADASSATATADGIDRTVSEAVATAVARQFAGQDVQVELESVALEPASLRDRLATGFGRVRLGSSESWIPFRYEALYDTDTAMVSAPRLALGERDIGGEAAGSELAGSLAGRVNLDLREEFAQQPFELLIDRVVTQPAGEGIVHVRGSGTVDFGAEGSTQTRIDALYDATSGRWLRVSYELGGTDDWSEPEPRAIAANF